MANTSDAVTTNPFYSTDSGTALHDVSSTWLPNATLYNDVLLNSTSDSPPRKIFIPCDNAENLVDKALADTSFLLFMFSARFFPFLGLFDRLGGVLE